MMGFIHIWSEITTWMGYSFKRKAQNPKQSNIFKKRASFLNLKLHIISLAKDTGVVCQPTKTAIFIDTQMKKTYLAVHFTKAFCQFVEKLFLTIFCLLCWCANREHPGSFQNKLVSSSLKWVLKYILFLDKLKGEGSLF